MKKTLIILALVLAGLAEAQGVVVGILAGISNDMSVEQQNARLKEYTDAGVRFMRTGIAPDDKGVEIAKRIYDQGIKILWIVRSQYRPDAPKRPYRKEFPHMWSEPPLSALDPEQFRTYFQTNLDKLEANGVQLAAFEMGNEINWAAFNGEFPVPEKGKGVLSLADLYHDSEGRQIAKGYLQYLKILAVLKDIRDHSRLNRHTPILTAGLMDAEEGDIPRSRGVEAVSFSATLDFMRANGLDNLVDGYGIHVYPNSNPGTQAAKRWESIEQETFVKECRPAGSVTGKPCWITELGNPEHRCVLPCTREWS